MIFQYGAAIYTPNQSFSERDFHFENQYGAAISPPNRISYFAALEKPENQYGAAIYTPNGCFSVRGATRLRTSRKPYKT